MLTPEKINVIELQFLCSLSAADISSESAGGDTADGAMSEFTSLWRHILVQNINTFKAPKEILL